MAETTLHNKNLADLAQRIVDNDLMFADRLYLYAYVALIDSRLARAEAEKSFDERHLTTAQIFDSPIEQMRGLCTAPVEVST